jgi:hypothetical protein
MEKKSRLSKGLFIAIFLLVALFGGIFGAGMFNFYVDDYYFAPFVSELDLSGYGYNSANLVIRDPKKVVVNQDLKTIEVANQSREYMIGIFSKKDIIIHQDIDKLDEAKEGEEENNLSSFYNINNPEAAALALTADGWLISIDKNLDGLLEKDLVAIDNKKNIYQIDEIKNLKEENLFLIHISQVDNLVPISFVDSAELKEGSSLIIVDYVNKQLISTLLEKDNNNELIKNSDELFSNLYLSYNDLDKFLKPILFNLEGKVVAFWNDDSWVPLDKYLFFWKNVLENEEENIFYPSLDVNYINLAEISFIDDNKVSGALIYPDKNGLFLSPDSPAKAIGLVEGDIIKAINDKQIDKDNSLNQLLGDYSSGEQVDLTVYRNDNLEIIPVTLNNNKKYDYKISK